MAVSDLSGPDAVLAVLAVATGVALLVAAAVLYLVRRPPEPPVGARTLDLGPESPALANFLVRDFRVTDEAVPATLIDLAARNVVDVEQRGPGVFYIRLRPGTGELLTAYERRVLEHLRGRAHDGVVPAGALTTGAGEESSRWRRGFTAEVVADAQARGLARDALGGRVFTALGAAAAVPALLVWALSAYQGAIVVFAVAVLGWIQRRHPQRETPEGLAAASRWLGVRAELAENEAFRTHSPLTVELWSRLLAYGAALGVASGASGPLPMGVESDTRAWSFYGGRWRPVRIRYPRFWPPGWGLDTLLALLLGLGATVASGVFLYGLAPVLLDAVSGGGSAVVVGAVILMPCAGVVGGVGLATIAALDLRPPVEMRGEILRLRVRGSDEKQRYYMAVDDGSSTSIRAFRVEPRHYIGLEQNSVVTVALTRNLGRVRWITREPASG